MAGDIGYVCAYMYVYVKGFHTCNFTVFINVYNESNLVINGLLLLLLLCFAFVLYYTSSPLVSTRDLKKQVFLLSEYANR